MCVNLLDGEMTHKNYTIQMDGKQNLLSFVLWMETLDVWKCHLPSSPISDKDSVEIARVMNDFIEHNIPFQIVFGKMAENSYQVLNRVFAGSAYELYDDGQGIIYAEARNMGRAKEELQ